MNTFLANLWLFMLMSGGKACEVDLWWDWKTHLRSCRPTGSGDQTWRCIDCKQRNVSIWLASVSVENRPLKWVFYVKLQCKSDCWVISLPTLTVFKPRCAEWKTVIITKQVLQNMLRSREPVSANSTIVWREKKRKLKKMRVVLSCA